MAGNRWIRLDVDYLDNPKVLAAGRDGRDLHLSSALWMGRVEKDGHIPGASVEHIARVAGLDPKRRLTAVDLVVAAGLWLPNGDGFYLNGFIERNGTKADHDKAYEQTLQRQRRYNAKRGERRDNDAS